MTRLLLATLLLFLGACKSTPSWLDLPGPAQTQGVRVVTEGAILGATMISGIAGEATNLSGGDISRCTISYEAYDMFGAVLGTARAEREGFESGEAWNFTAKFPRYLESVVTVSSARVLVVP